MAEKESKQPTAEERKSAITEYHKATTKEAKSAVVKKYPFLEHVFAQLNHT